MFSVCIYQFNYWWFDIFPFIYLVINSTYASVITNVATQSTLVSVYVCTQQKSLQIQTNTKFCLNMKMDPS